MNNFFTNIGHKFSKQIQEPANTVLSCPSKNPNSMYLNPTVPEEVLKIIHKMENKMIGVD